MTYVLPDKTIVYGRPFVSYLRDRDPPGFCPACCVPFWTAVRSSQRGVLASTKTSTPSREVSSSETKRCGALAQELWRVSSPNIAAHLADTGFLQWWRRGARAREAWAAASVRAPRACALGVDIRGGGLR